MKKKLFFKFFLFTVLAAFVTFTSCKNYDDDIDDLNDKITNLSSLSTDLTAAKADIVAAQNSANNALAKANEALAAAEAAGDPAGIQAAQDAADAAQLAADKAQADADALLLQVQALEDKVAALEALDSPSKAELQALADEIEALQENVIATFGLTNSMITGISFDYEGDDWSERDRDLDFTTTLARVDYTFATGVANPITFVKGQRQATAGVKIMAKVSPANADLSTMLDKIKLIRSDANAQINNYVFASKAERATPLLTRATPTATGLWEITFDLPTSSDLTEFRKLIQTPTAPFNQYLFALAIENTVDQGDDAEDRFVISDFAIALSADDITPIYNNQDYPNDLVFSARNVTDAAWTAHTGIQNRYGILDPVSNTNLFDQAWPGAWAANATPINDVNDNRFTQPLLNVEVAKEFNVRIDNSDIYGYYVTLDKKYAVESAPSELVAWESYSYEGLNKVYMADEVAKLKINSASAGGDIIGFRVHAVNWDGTLVDPDGKSFYVGVGASPSATLAFTQTITTPLAAGVSVPSDKLAFTSPVGVNINSYDFTMTIGHGVVLTNANIAPLDANDVVVTTTWAAVKKLQIIGVIPADLEEGKTYTGTLTLKNTLGIPVHISTLTLTKVLPTADLGITYKTTIHHAVNGSQVIYGYPIPNGSPATLGTYDLVTALNIPAGMTNLVVTNTSTYPAASLPTWNVLPAHNFGLTETANVPAAEIGVPYLPAAAPGHGKIYDLTLSRNFGPVKYDATATAGVGQNYNLAWTGTPAIKVEFRSFVQDLHTWEYVLSGTPAVEQTPVLKYGQDVTGYAMTNITAVPPVGNRTDLTNTPALQDGRTFTVKDVRVLTGANFNVANEYFVPVLTGLPATIDFTAVNTSTPAGPVPTKLEVTLTDDYGHDYTFVIPKVFNMTLN